MADETYRGPQLAKKGEDKPGLSPITGKICLIGIINNSNLIQLGADQMGEADAIKKAFEFFRPQNAPFVTFNGSSFDLPFLAVRAMKFGIPIPNELKNALQRYPKNHVDLFIALNFGKFPPRGSLKHWSWALLGREGQYRDGEEVQKWYDAGEWAHIRTHNTTTLFTTDDIYRAFDKSMR